MGNTLSKLNISSQSVSQQQQWKLFNFQYLEICPQHFATGAASWLLTELFHHQYSVDTGQLNQILKIVPEIITTSFLWETIHIILHWTRKYRVSTKNHSFCKLVKKWLIKKPRKTLKNFFCGHSVEEKAEFGWWWSNIILMFTKTNYCTVNWAGRVISSRSVWSVWIYFVYCLTMITTYADVQWLKISRGFL